MKKIAKSWQSDALDDLRAAMNRGHRASLLQLPPGLGKTLVAIRFFRALKLKYRQLIIAVPSQNWNHRDPWKDELDAAKIRIMDPEADPDSVRSGTAVIITHRQLMAVLEGRGQRLPQRWIAERYRTLIVVDEYHGARRLKESLAKAFWSDDESIVPVRMRRMRGSPPKYPLWLFLSATPYNPVRLDYDIDSRKHDSAPDEESVEDEAKVLRDEVRQTVGALAWIDRRSGAREKLDEYLKRLFSRLCGGTVTAFLRVPAVSIIPRSSAALHPLPPRPISLKIPRVDSGSCIDALWKIHTSLASLGRIRHRVSTAERMFLGGVRAAVGKKGLYGHTYSESTMTAMRALRRIANVEGAEVKLASITELVERLWCANAEKIVIFCVHRAVASGVAKHLRSSLRLARGVVTDASQEYGSKLETHCNGFNDATKLPGVLVTTDKLAESIGLHKACSALIHYELPWSPLRVVQRFGRLWRIKTRHQKRPSRAPQVFHVIHPGSIEEEVLHRLERRWGHLSALGLDYLPIEYGLGKRVPKVSWR